MGFVIGILLLCYQQGWVSLEKFSGQPVTKHYVSKDWHFSLDYQVPDEQNYLLGENKFSEDWMSVLFSDHKNWFKPYSIEAAKTTVSSTQDYLDQLPGYRIIAWMDTYNNGKMALVETKVPNGLGQGETTEDQTYGKSLAAIVVKNSIVYTITTEQVDLGQEIEVPSTMIQTISSFRILE